MEINSLQLLTVYGTNGESSDEDVPGSNVSTKRSFKEDVKRLPLPDSLRPSKCPSWIDNPAEHQGRVRLFKHERGNWATFVYIPCESCDGLSKLQDPIIKALPSLGLVKTEDFHLSLTKTVVLKYHWIHPFMNSVKERLTGIPRFILILGDLKIYCNEGKSRTFIGVEVMSAYDTLNSIIHELDTSLSEFQLPEFYKDPSFHISILWCLGDRRNELESYLPYLNHMLNNMKDLYPDLSWYIKVDYLYCKTGNKKFQFPLD